MKLRSLVDEVADSADAFLATIDTRKDAREAISEYVQEHHPELSRKELNVVVNGVLQILEGEDFFGDAGAGIATHHHRNIDED